jgi:predicted SAM-dependent methyltransferase
MLHQRTRDLYFAGLRPFNKLNYWRWKAQALGRNGAAGTHLHLGCGTKYLLGFVNIDGNLFRKCDMWLDLRNGLPFGSGRVSSIYSSHVFEHFYPDELQHLLRECYRVLRPGGGLRIVVPDMGRAARAYLFGQQSFFTDFPRRHKSIGGKLSNVLFCEGGHRQGFDFSYLEELLREAGFSEVWELEAQASAVYPAEVFAKLREEETGVASISLFVECRK